MGLQDSSVFLDLDGETVELKATLEAAQVMSRTYGGMQKLYQGVTEMDIDAICVAIRAGLMLDGDEAKALPNKVFKTGMIKLMPDVGAFVLLVASGGVRSDDKAEPESPEPGKP